MAQSVWCGERVRPLEWINDRWHCEGKPIYAGSSMEILCPDRTWLPVCIESRNCGRQLLAEFDYHGLRLVHWLDKSDWLRWPPKNSHKPRYAILQAKTGRYWSDGMWRAKDDETTFFEMRDRAQRVCDSIQYGYGEGAEVVCLFDDGCCVKPEAV